jgi:phosphoglycolate phosphatase
VTTFAPAVVTKPWTCILFDLDGTITDSASGITSRLAETLARMNLPVARGAAALRRPADPRCIP